MKPNGRRFLVRTEFPVLFCSNIKENAPLYVSMADLSRKNKRGGSLDEENKEAKRQITVDQHGGR